LLHNVELEGAKVKNMDETVIIGFTIFVVILVYISQNAKIRAFNNVGIKNRFSRVTGCFIEEKIVNRDIDLFKNDGTIASNGFHKRGETHNTYLSVIKCAHATSHAHNPNKTRNVFYTWTLICVVDKHFHLPNLTLYSEGIGSKLLASIGAQDIDFKEDPLFSKRFVLQGQSVVNAKDFFTKDMRTFFVQNFPKGFYFDTAEDRFIIRLRGRASKGELETLVNLAQRLQRKLK
jgi:hypothetical protein